jgi:hypothetical protein
MERKLIEELYRNKELMGLNEDTTPPSSISVSKDGTVNFFDLGNKKAYKYKLIAKALGRSFDVVIKSIDLNNGTMVYIDPDTKKEETEVINDESKQNIIQNFRNGENFENLHSFRTKKGIKVTINLNFVGEYPINIKP